MNNIQRNQETMLHAGHGIRPQHDVFLKLAEDGKVILRQVVYDSGGQGTYHYTLGSLIPEQYERLLAEVPQWVWGCGLYSNNSDKWWYKAVQWVIDGDFTPLWEDIFPYIVDDGIVEAKKVVLATKSNRAKLAKASYQEYAKAQAAPIVKVPARWPDKPSPQVRWMSAGVIEAD